MRFRLLFTLFVLVAVSLSSGCVHRKLAMRRAHRHGLCCEPAPSCAPCGPACAPSLGPIAPPLPHH